MANIIVYADFPHHGFTPQSEGAVAWARAISRALGAGVHVAVASGPLPQPRLVALAAQVGQLGADKLLVCVDPLLAGPALDASHGRFLFQMGTRLRPLLFLFGAGEGATQLAAPLALRLGGGYWPDASLLLEAGSLTVARERARRDSHRRLSLQGLERPLVVALKETASAPRAAGNGPAELELMSYPTSVHAQIEQVPVERT